MDKKSAAPYRLSITLGATSVLKFRIFWILESSHTIRDHWRDLGQQSIVKYMNNSTVKFMNSNIK